MAVVASPKNHFQLLILPGAAGVIPAIETCWFKQIFAVAVKVAVGLANTVIGLVMVVMQLPVEVKVYVIV